MNQPNNERFQHTERCLIDAFVDLLTQKDISKISVSELCRVCGIHRSSFYLHFSDIYALMERVEAYLAVFYGRLFTETEEYYDLGERFLMLFRFIQEHRSFYKVYWFRSKDLRVLDIALPDQADQSLRQTAHQYGINSEVELTYHQLFFKSGLSALIGFWLSRDCAESPEELLNLLEQEYSGR